MKKIVLVFYSLLSSICYSQSIDYPKIETDSLGQKIVIMTLEQAQSLDNTTELVPLYEKMNIQSNESELACIKVVDEKNQVIAKQDIQIGTLKNLVENNQKQISNLQEQIKNYLEKEILYKKEIENKDKEINLHLDKIKSQKKKVLISGGIGILIGFTIGLFVN